MATLTEISVISRKIIRYSIYAVIVITIGRMTINGAIAIYKRLFPAPPPAPTVAFGKLPALTLPEKPVIEGLQYTLQTPDGNLPILPDQLPIYFMPSPVSTLGALDTAKAVASQLGFDPATGKIVVDNVPNVYVFEKSQGSSNLTINIITGIWSISRDLRTEPSLVGNIPPAPEAAIENAKSMLSLPGQAASDMTGRPIYKLLRVDNGQLIPAISLSEADVIKVNLFRKNFGLEGEYPSITPEFPVQSNVWFLLSGQGRAGVVAGEYHYFPIDEKTFATYPTITSEQAWEALNSGNGIITNIGNNSSKQIVIRRVYLGYYDPGQYSQFFQPVVVFEGDNEFAAIVPAVTPEYYGQ